ncbi:MAG: extracellular solute-binding protein [Myxococcales bacterium]|nr:extracellular solute-binding protein [Myxococcales bacterium]
MRALAREALALVCAMILIVCARDAAAQRTVTVWHPYRGAEQQAFDQVLQAFERAHPGVSVTTLAVPFDAYAAKLEAAIPRGNGPDLFVDAHERIPSYLARRIITSADTAIARVGSDLEPIALEAVQSGSERYGVPLALKCLALFVDEELWERAGRPSLDSLESIARARAALPPSAYPLVYYASNAYFHSAIVHALGGQLFDPQRGTYAFDGSPAIESLTFVQRLLADRVIPPEVDGASVTPYFRSGRAMTVISGPWLVGELGGGRRYRVVVLPRVRDGGRVMSPFVTVEVAFLASNARAPELANELAAYLASPAAARVRATVGRQVVATQSVWSEPELANDAVLAAFRRAASRGRVMPTHNNMRLSWEPANQAIRRALRDPRATRVAIDQGRRRYEDASRPLPAKRSPLPLQLALGLIALAIALRSVQRARDPDFRAAVKRSMPAYAYVTHAVVIVALLVVLPLVLGATTSLYAGRDGALEYVGGANYWDIITARGGSLFASGTFYAVLLVTVLWTVANLALHVSIGVVLALVLSRPLLKLRAVYRVLLIIPWAVPSYVTALAWKGIFHRQTGAMNAILSSLGVEPISWFAQFSTAFAANVVTNTWLGFPFMMVVTIGALAAIPKDLYEAAEVDGATPWQQFRHITLPLLRPTLLPAVSMGAVWTFNQFNVIFLVSGGEPDGATEILVTEAYRWAFTRQAQYGYAAAYAVLIFGVLVLGTRLLERLTLGKQGGSK